MNYFTKTPDISYHLIFCFLSLEELCLIAQCSKEWKRLVTAPSFLNMFPNEYEFQCTNGSSIDYVTRSIEYITNEYKIQNAYNSSFCPLIHGIRIKQRHCNWMMTSCLVYFHRLVSLHLKIDWCQDNENKISHVFEALGSRLRELNIKIYGFNNKAAQFYLFQNALSHLTQLNSFTLRSYNKIMTNLSFLSHMKDLQLFSCDCIHCGVITNQDLINHLLTLDNLTTLYLDDIHKDQDLIHGLFTMKNLNQLYLTGEFFEVFSHFVYEKISMEQLKE
jgi:hypothetical protein